MYRLHTKKLDIPRYKKCYKNEKTADANCHPSNSPLPFPLLPMEMKMRLKKPQKFCSDLNLNFYSNLSDRATKDTKVVVDIFFTLSVSTKNDLLYLHCTYCM